MADSTVTIVVAANEGYHITGWSNAVSSHDTPGNPNDLTADTVYITMEQDTVIGVSFDTNIYNVTYTVQNDEREGVGTGTAMGSVTLAGRHMHFLYDTLAAEAAYGRLEAHLRCIDDTEQVTLGSVF